MKTKTVNMIIALLLMMLPAVGALQFYWISKLSSEHQAVLTHNIENSSGLVMDDLNQLLMRVHRHFTRVKHNKLPELQSELLTRLADSKNMDFAGYIDDIFISESGKNVFYKLNPATQSIVPAQDFKYTAEILKMSAPRTEYETQPNENNSLKADMNLMILVFDVNGTNYIVSLCLDRRIFKQISEKYIKRYFATSQDYQIDIKIVNTKSLILIQSTNPSDHGKIDTTGTITRFPLGFLPPAMPMKMNGGMSVPPPPKETMKNKEMGDIGKFSQRRFSQPTTPFMIIIQSRNNSVEDFFGKYRLQNYSLSTVSIFALLMALILLIFAFKKNEKIANERIGFIAGISHEFRTPLAVIRAASENIRDGVIRDPDKMKSYGALIYDEIDKLWQMVEQSLAMVGVRSASPKDNTEQIEISNFLANLCEDFEAECTAKQLELEFVLAENQFLQADTQALRSIFSNILSNAIKYNKPNGKIYVKYDVDKNKNKLIVSISDTGIGIKRTEVAEIFKPFFRAESAINIGVQGSGIGLALVKAQIDKLGGKIKIKSKENIGTIVTIILPVDYAKK